MTNILRDLMSENGNNNNGTPNADILHLLKAAETPQERAMLSVMLQMTRALESNTTATEAIAEGFHAHVEEFKQHREEFDKHVRDEIELFAQGRGMQKMLTYSVSGLGAVMTIILSMGLYILNGHVEGLLHERQMNDQQEKRLTIIEQTPRITRGEFEDLRNRTFMLETLLNHQDALKRGTTK
jgi:hypothetical protein